MTGLDLVQPGLLALKTGLWLTAGVLIGTLHFLTLRWNVSMFVLGRSRLLAFALQLARAALLAALLFLISSRFGALPLLLAAGGILAARMAALRLEVQK